MPQQQGPAQPAGERDQVQERHAREEPGLGGREQDPAKGQENVHMMMCSARVRARDEPPLPAGIPFRPRTGTGRPDGEKYSD